MTTDLDREYRRWDRERQNALANAIDRARRPAKMPDEQQRANDLLRAAIRAATTETTQED